MPSLSLGLFQGSCHRYVLALAFLCSGSAGLVFEVIWFRQFAWVLGGTVWAATAVLTAFMAGLCIGYWAARHYSPSPGSAVRVYIFLELLVGVCGSALVLLIPELVTWLSGGAGLVSRFLVATLLMLVPTVAMGMTLPILVAAITATQQDTGARLGLLYGLNTLGACGGVLAAEFVLIPTLGLAASGGCAALLNLLAAGLGLLLLGVIGDQAKAREQPEASPVNTAPLVVVAMLTGAAVLMLEIVGFRLLLLSVRGTSEAFAVMLATVLVGIGLGALLWIGRRSSGERLLRECVAVCFGMAILVVLGYVAMLLPGFPDMGSVKVWLLSGMLFLPCCLLSGWLLPALTAAMSEQGTASASATASLFLANTSGGAVGAALAGLLLLPQLGVESSLILVAAMLSAAGFILSKQRVRTLPVSLRLAVPSGLLCLLVLSHLDGLLWQRHAQIPLRPFVAAGETAVAQREGLNETAQLLRRDVMGNPIAWRLVTNAHSMSNTERDSRRYMKQYVWLPMLLSSGISDALLISYGTGSTARALTDGSEARRIDIVDPSEAVLSLSGLVHGERNPLADARVQVHVEDGRHYLLTTDRRYDLITGEPPPPRLAGIVNLYSQEYFQLMRNRLKPGGWASYWLPVDQLSVDSSRSIVAAFCMAFADCSLWAGSNYNWMLLGSNKASRSTGSARIQRLWDSAQRAELETLGFEFPELMGAAFIADATQLDEFTVGRLPLRDNFPGRLTDSAADTEALRFYQQWSDVALTRQRFVDSSWVRQHWPLHQESLAVFRYQPVLNNEIDPMQRPWLAASLASLVLEEGRYRVPAMWLLNSGLDEANLAFAANRESAVTLRHKAILALVGGQPDKAVSLFRQMQPLHRSVVPAAVLAACRAGEPSQASAWFAFSGASPDAADDLRCW